MTRSEWKAAARARLGGGIFKDQWLMGVVFCLVVSAIVGAAGSILPGIGALVVTGPMLYAQKYAFLAQAREGRGIDLNDLFRGFRDDFGGTLLISLLSGLFIFLWSLLLFIPGIVKAYAYSMVYYVKADHPEYGWRECLDESQRLMTGHKWEKFVLDLSFIGWGIVGSLCLGVGMLWVMTYMAATEAQYYEYLRQNLPRILRQRQAVLRGRLTVFPPHLFTFPRKDTPLWSCNTLPAISPAPPSLPPPTRRSRGSPISSASPFPRSSSA